MTFVSPPRGIPEGSCVWVSAGVISYYVCTRDFRCDDCPLHQALSHNALRQLDADPTWPHDRRYTAHHLWVQQSSEHSAQIGLTALAAQLLNPVERWRTADTGQPVRSGSCIVTAETDGGPLSLTLPFDVEAITYNRRIDIDPIWPLADPWDSGFLATVEIPDWEHAAGTCMTLGEASPEINRIRKRVSDELTEAGYTRRAETRSADGGLPVDGLVTAIGVARYRNLLADIFRLPDGN